jgi:hypothetical protein
MPPEKCEFPVSQEDFLKLPQGNQNALIYSCLRDLQEKTDWRWKQVLFIGAISGFIGGFCNPWIKTLFGMKNL